MAIGRGFLAVAVLALVSLVQTDAALPPECMRPVDRGTCGRAIPLYFYNAETQQCEQFTFGGCGRNEDKRNAFHSLEMCQARCMPQGANTNSFHYDHTDVCQRPPQEEAFRCTEPTTRFYFNTAQRACLSFTYPGCFPNGNSFASREECEARCVTDNDKDYGNYDNSDTCMQEPTPGMCRAAMPRYYYNRHLGVCGVFVYGGCGGNSNNFFSLESCNERCGNAGTIGGSYPTFDDSRHQAGYSFPVFNGIAIPLSD